MQVHLEETIQAQVGVSCQVDHNHSTACCMSPTWWGEVLHQRKISISITQCSIQQTKNMAMLYIHWSIMNKWWVIRYWCVLRCMAHNTCGQTGTVGRGLFSSHPWPHTHIQASFHTNRRIPVFDIRRFQLISGCSLYKAPLSQTAILIMILSSETGN